MTPDRSLADAIGVMQAGETRSVLVTEADGRLVGIFTERDVVLRALGPAVDLRAPIEHYMSRDPEAVHPDDNLGHALDVMQRGRHHGLPVVDGTGRVIGHLDSRDVLEYVAEAFPQEVLNLPPRPHQLLDQPEGA